MSGSSLDLLLTSHVCAPYHGTDPWSIYTDQDAFDDVRRADIALGYGMFSLWAVYNLYFASAVMLRLFKIRRTFGPPLRQLPFDLPKDVTDTSADDDLRWW